jgi:hypothetical protein
MQTDSQLNFHKVVVSLIVWSLTLMFIYLPSIWVLGTVCDNGCPDSTWLEENLKGIWQGQFLQISFPASIIILLGASFGIIWNALNRYFVFALVLAVFLLESFNLYIILSGTSKVAFLFILLYLISLIAFLVISQTILKSNYTNTISKKSRVVLTIIFMIINLIPLFFLTAWMI